MVSQKLDRQTGLGADQAAGQTERAGARGGGRCLLFKEGGNWGCGLVGAGSGQVKRENQRESGFCVNSRSRSWGGTICGETVVEVMMGGPVEGVGRGWVVSAVS